MDDIDYQIESLRKALASEEEVLAVISCAHNHAELRERVNQLQLDIKKLETWKADQQKIRIQTAYSNGAPSGGA
jgi:hypothetical protein